jgi:competence protein ComEC
LELVVLDVGQGDAALLRSPRGRWILVDAGPTTSRYDAGAKAVVPYLRKRGVAELEFMILTHPDMDHVGGAGSVLAEIEIGAVLDPGMPAGTQAFLGALEAARAGGVPWKLLQAGDSMNLDGMALRVLAPEGGARVGEGDGANGASIVLEVRFGEFSALLTGDAPAESEGRFLTRTLSPRISVLKVGHHGSSTSTSPELLRRIGAEVGLISVGRRNRFGHPDFRVLSRLREEGVQIFRTDQSGALRVRARADGSYSVSTEGM